MKNGSISEQLEMQERQISDERKNTDMQTGLYADKQGEPNENKVAHKQDDNLSNDIENKQSFNLPDLGLSSALGLLTPDVNNDEDQQQTSMKRKKKKPKKGIRR